MNTKTILVCDIETNFETDLFRVVTSRYAMRLKGKRPTPPIESYDDGQ